MPYNDDLLYVFESIHTISYICFVDREKHAVPASLNTANVDGAVVSAHSVAITETIKK